MDPNSIMQQPPAPDHQQQQPQPPVTTYRDLMSIKTPKYISSKMFDSSPTYKSGQQQVAMSNPNPKEPGNYLEQFPPPSFGSPVKTANRGRGGSFGSNTRGRQQPPRNTSNFNNQGRNQQQFSRGGGGSGGAGPYGNRGPNERRQFNNNEYSNDGGSPFSNFKQNSTMGNMANRRGNRGGSGGPFSVGGKQRGMDGGQGFQQRPAAADPWYQHDEETEPVGNESGYQQHKFDEQEYFQTTKEKNQEFEECGGYADWNAVDKVAQHGQDYEQDYFQMGNEPPAAPKRLGETGGPPVSQLQQDLSRMNPQQRNGGFFPGGNNAPRPPQMRQPERNHRPPMNAPRQTMMLSQQSARPPQNAAASLRAPVKLMDVVVQLSHQSPVIRRRQQLVDKWQRDAKDALARRGPVSYFFPLLTAALSPDVRNMLFVNCCGVAGPGGCITCELVLDDVFLVQARGDSEELAIEAASKMLLDMFKARVYVITASRDVDGEQMPGFCISASQFGTVNLPPVSRPVTDSALAHNANSINNAQLLASLAAEAKVDHCSRAAPPAPPPMPAGHQSAEQGIFLVLETATNERDQSIASLVATARFNCALIDYQHEKLPHAPHISSCVITIDGCEVERHEARDYLVAKRQAADKVVAKLKQTRPQITLRFDKARVVKRDELLQKKDESMEKAASEFLQKAASSTEDVPLKFDCDFSVEERASLTTVAAALGLSHKTEGKNTLFIFKQFPLADMKKLLLGQGYCAQFQLVERGSDCGGATQ